MPWPRLLFLVFVLAVSSGYRFRCYWLCTDQTAIQNDYIEERDRCREYAQLKLDMAIKNIPGQVDERTRKSQLVALFSECMGNNGWVIPAGDSKPPVTSAATNPPGQEKPAQQQPVNAANANAGLAPAQPPPQNDAFQEKAALTRQAECAFARRSAANSSISAARARACDLECAQRMRLAPEAPRAAACPSDVTPRLSKGVERSE